MALKPGCAHLQAIKSLYLDQFLAPRQFVPRHCTSAHLSHFCNQDNLSATYQICTAIAPASDQVCTWMAKTRAIASLHRDNILPKVPRPCPDAASANATSLYCRAVMCNRLHSNSLDNMIETKSTNQDFHCIVTNGKIAVDSDAPPSKGGLSNGFRPHELLEAALATCINITIRMTAKEKKINLDYVSTQVDIDRSDTKTTFKYKILLDNKLSDSDRDFLMNIIDFCAVKQSLTKQLDFLQYE
jgi:putative redox protein